MLDETHSADLRSWVKSAESADTDFPIQNLPFGVFSRAASARRIGVAIGDEVLDVSACLEAGLLRESEASRACTGATLNALMALSSDELTAFRTDISALLRDGTTAGTNAREHRQHILVPRDSASMHLPAEIGDYTDFYASVHHATNVGRMFRPDNPLLPNYKYVPIAYHGRASSIVVSGTDVTRPKGQITPNPEEAPRFAATRMLDYEAELGCFIGRGNAMGQPVDIGAAREHVFGYCLVNDWSARDIQSWEYQPLGPFLAKNFATTVSPWIVTSVAVEPFRVAAAQRDPGDPQPLPHLHADHDQARGGLNVTLEVYLTSEEMRARRMKPVKLSASPFSLMYWTVAQMIAHHTSNGCNLRTGDLLASGTVSGPDADSLGCLLELTRRGQTPVQLPSGETRAFLEDGDEVIMRGALDAPGRRRIGFGDCRGTIRPASA